MTDNACFKWCSPSPVSFCPAHLSGKFESICLDVKVKKIGVKKWLTKSKKAYNIILKKWVCIEKWKNTYQAHYKKCEAERCLCCGVIECSPVFESYVTKDKFILMKDGIFSCKSTFLIYLITCGDCGIQYVGQTIQFLHIRLNGHRSSTKNSLNTYVYQHFNSHGHDFTKIKIQIIDILDPKIYDKHDLDTLENFWINTLETAYPFGLNDKVKGTGNISKNKYFNENLTCYFSSHTKRCRRSHGISKKNKKLDINYEAYNHGSVDNNINQLSYLIKNQINKFYIKVKSYGKKIIKLILNDLADRDIPMHNIITSYLNNRQKINEIAKKAEEREHIILSFNCKFIDKLCFNSILRDTSIESLLPKPIADKLPLKIYYKYNKHIGKELLNYNSFLNNLKNYDIKEIVDSDCECYYSMNSARALRDLV